MHKVHPRVAYTRGALKSALVALMRQKPIARITVTDLCAHADINRSTFYLHYKDAYELLGELEGDLMLQMQQAMAQYGGKHGDLLPMIHVIADNPELCRCIASEHGDPRFVERMSKQSREAFLQYCLRAQSALPAEQASLLYAFVSAGCASLISAWLHTGCKETPEEVSALLKRIADGCLQSFGFAPLS